MEKYMYMSKNALSYMHLCICVICQKGTFTSETSNIIPQTPAIGHTSQAAKEEQQVLVCNIIKDQ